MHSQHSQGNIEIQQDHKDKINLLKPEIKLIKIIWNTSTCMTELAQKKIRGVRGTRLGRFTVWMPSNRSLPVTTHLYSGGTKLSGTQEERFLNWWASSFEWRFLAGENGKIQQTTPFRFLNGHWKLGTPTSSTNQKKTELFFFLLSLSIVNYFSTFNLLTLDWSMIWGCPWILF